MLKPGGSFSFAIGSLSAPDAIGGGATGASFAAASLSAGRPIRGEPGGSGAAAGAAAGAGAAGACAAGCCAVAATVNDVKKTPASKARRAVEWIILKPPWLEILVRKHGAAAFLGRQSPIFPVRCAIGNRDNPQCLVAESSGKSIIASEKGNSSTISPSS